MSIFYIFDKGFNGTVVNLEFPSLHVGIKIKLTVPIKLDGPILVHLLSAIDFFLFFYHIFFTKKWSPTFYREHFPLVSVKK